MISQLENLSIEEKNLLLKAPVLLSVLASCSNHTINRHQKADAIKLAHLKPFTANPELIPFYVEVEKRFEEQFETVVREYGPFDDTKCGNLKQEIKKIYPILEKLDRDYARKLVISFEKYERHVRKAGHTVVEDFIFPVPIPGLSD